MLKKVDGVELDRVAMLTAQFMSSIHEFNHRFVLRGTAYYYIHDLVPLESHPRTQHSNISLIPSEAEPSYHQNDNSAIHFFNLDYIY